MIAWLPPFRQYRHRQMTDHTHSVSSGKQKTSRRVGQHPAGAADLLLKRMEEMHDFPAVSRNIIEINEKAAPRSLASATQLASVILKDYSLTTKLLKMVNSAIYGQFAGQIATVSRAVVILGFEQVRLVATSLIIFEHIQSRGQQTELKTALLSSFLSGIMARDLAARMSLSSTEEVFICAILHNFGKLMIMYYLPEKYEQIKNLTIEEGLAEKEAARRVLRSSYDEISMAIAELWGLPETIINSMRQITDVELDKWEGAPADARLVSCFANEVYDLAVADLPFKEKKEHLRLLSKKYERVIPISENKIEEMVETANNKAKDFSFVLGISPAQRQMLQKLNFKGGDENKAESASSSSPKAAASQPPLDLRRFHFDTTATRSSNEPALTPDQQLIMMNGIRDVTHALLEESYSLDDVLTMVVETIFRGLEFPRVLICIKNAKTNTMEGRHGLGPYIDEVIRKFRFPISKGDDIFNMSLAQHDDIFIPDINAPGVSAGIPGWYRGILKASLFILLPIVINNISIGLIYVDMKGTDKGVTAEKLNYLKMLRDQIVLAVRQKSK
jgi:HD-like signal output (HDOD) protein